MNVIARERQDPPIQPGEIEFGSALPALAPRRVKESQAVPALRQSDAALKKFEAEAAAEKARLEKSRADAVAIQENYQAMLARRDGIAKYVAQAEAQLLSCKARVSELEEYAKNNLGSPLHDHIWEHTQRNFLAARIPQWLEGWKADLARLDTEVASFRAEHGIES